MKKVEFEGRVLNERFLLRKVGGDVFEVKDLEGELGELLYGMSFHYRIYRCQAGSRNYLLFEAVSKRAGFVVEGREILSYYLGAHDFIKCVVNGEEWHVVLGNPRYDTGLLEIEDRGYWLWTIGYVFYPEIRFVMHGDKLTPILLVTLRKRGDRLYLFEYRRPYKGDKIWVDSGFNSLNVIRSVEGNVEGISILPDRLENSVFVAPLDVYTKFFAHCKFHRASKRRIVISLDKGLELVDYSDILRYLNLEELSFTLVAERDGKLFISSDFRHWIEVPVEVGKERIISEDGLVDLKHYSCGKIVVK